MVFGPVAAADWNALIAHTERAPRAVLHPGPRRVRAAHIARSGAAVLVPSRTEQRSRAAVEAVA
jgi:hypothetical protein